MSTFRFRRLKPRDVAKHAAKPALDEKTLRQAKRIVNDVRRRGERALRRHAARFGDLRKGERLFIDKKALRRAYLALVRIDKDLLQRTSARVREFAMAQKRCLKNLSRTFPGGRAGHELLPVERVGCYVPGGRYPLPSTVLMTVIPARVAGVKEIWVATPRPTPLTLAAAWIAGADGVLAVGGAQAIAALGYGLRSFKPCDMIVGPGNQWVTAAKKIIAGEVAIDMLAGPTELVILADSGAEPEVVAADLLAQAEHDPHARPILISLGEELIRKVEREIDYQLRTLPSARIARQALQNGFAVAARSLGEAARLINALAPEHVQVMLEDSGRARPLLLHCGALFLGDHTGEVFGDYAFGPNHVLPTGRGARFTGGLSVFNFIRVRTWLRVRDRRRARVLMRDASRLARLENLEAHARAADIRLVTRPSK